MEVIKKAICTYDKRLLDDEYDMCSYDRDDCSCFYSDICGFDTPDGSCNCDLAFN